MSSPSRRIQGNAEDGDPLARFTGAANTFAQLQRQHLAATAETMSALFRAEESIHHAQVQRDQRAALLHRQAAENLRNAATPADLAMIQSSLAMYGFQEAVRYWQDLAAAAMKAGGEVMRAGAPASTEADNGAASLSAGLGSAGFMADAFQQMFNAPLKAAQARH